MMNLHSLKPAEKATKASKRIGRGQGSGKGGTSTRGHKGAQSRSGYSRKVGFEGGQMPIYRLLPKRGFKNINRIEYSPINLDTLQKLADKTKTNEITLALMRANGLISKKDLVKILGNGEITTKLSVTAHAFSKSAKEAIQKLGGTVIILHNGDVEVEVAVEENIERETQKTEPIAEVVPEEPIAEAIPEEPIAEAVPEEPIAEVVPEEPIAEAIPEEPIAEAIPEEPIAEAVPEEPIN